MTADKTFSFADYGGDKRFLAVLQEIAVLHERKQRDYGTEGDPFANINASREFGIPPYTGIFLRMGDKFQRIKSYCVNGTLANEGVEDTLMDLAVYSLISLVLFREEKHGSPAKPGVQIPD